MKRLRTHHVFLIPGFFGFVNFGKLVYFTHVREVLEDACSRERLRVEIHRVALQPTSSLRVRATGLLRAIRESAPPDMPIHLVGHSTGGLDARLATTPSLSLADAADDTDAETLARRVRSIVCVATPHRGTPLADFFSSLMGQHVLRLLSATTIAVLRHGRLPVGLLARIAAGVGKLATTARRRPAPLELLAHLETELLGTLAPEQRDLVGRFVEDVSGDQSLIPQLAPAAMDLFDTTTADRPGVRYTSVVAQAPPPRLATRLALGPRPWLQATYAFYTWLHGRVGDGDGIVPVASQRRGHILAEARADHLDVIGHFDDPDHQPPHTDWIVSGSRFDRPQFEALWQAVARFIATA